MRPCTGIAPEFKFAGYSLLEGGEWGDAVALGKFQRPDRGNEVCTRLTAGGNRIRTFGTAEDAGVLAGLRVWIAPIPAVPVCEIGPLESTPLNHSWPVSIRQRPQSGDVWPTSRLPHFAVGSPGDVPPRCAARKGRVFASASDTSNVNRPNVETPPKVGGVSIFQLNGKKRPAADQRAGPPPAQHRRPLSRQLARIQRAGGQGF
jgi:hypothetical protein